MGDIEYEKMLAGIFERFPSVQSSGFSADAYKPGLENMRRFDEALGFPSSELKCIHVAGTNGKGSVSNMIAASLAASGYLVGLYTSPHILDFRERARMVDAGGFTLIGKDYVCRFLSKWGAEFDRLGLSFFEITTGLAFKWFADMEVDVAVIEVGLGGRLDSTNIIVPELSVVTSIGLDHCVQLGTTRAAIAGEKAGIFKQGVPALVWGHDIQTDEVFEGRASEIHCPLFYADEIEVPDMGSWLSDMDLGGAYQGLNLRTAVAALELLGEKARPEVLCRTARMTGFRGRWEFLRRRPDVICDIGHNPPALMHNFAQLGSLLASGKYESLVIVYGVMADKDLEGIIPLMPESAKYIFVTPSTARALPSEEVLSRFLAIRPGADACDGGSVESGVRTALSASCPGTLVYIGGSTYVVSEALPLF